MDLSLPRGIRDIEPEEFRLQEKVRESFYNVARLYMFELMEPAPIEHLATLRIKSGGEVDSQIYTFKDKGGRDVGLRFDLTVGMTRYVCSRRDLKPPIKLGCVGGAWRYEEPQHARYRWFGQWDLEIFGPPSVSADAEVIDASDAILRGLHLDNRLLQIGDRKVVEEYITKVLKVDSKESVVEFMRALDKVQKKTRAELEKEYSQKGLSAADLSALLDFGSLRGTPDFVLQRLSEQKLESASQMNELRDSLRSRGIKNLEYNMSIVRGIDYYTGIVFEITDRQNEDLGALCGGGRYDMLPALFGRPELSATGAAGGLDREALSIRGQKDDRRKWVFVAPAGKEMEDKARELVVRIRAEQWPADADQIPRSLSKQLAAAGALGAGWVMIIGKREDEQGVVTLKDMMNGTEEKLSFDEAMARIRKKN